MYASAFAKYQNNQKKGFSRYELNNQAEEESSKTTAQNEQFAFTNHGYDFRQVKRAYALVWD